MLTVAFALEDDTQPRTVFHQKFTAAVRNNKRFTSGSARVLVPAEDVSIETNWPRYGNRESAYVRGTSHDILPTGLYPQYMTSLVSLAQRNASSVFLVVNMHPSIRIPLILRSIANVVCADGCLASFERSLNPRTISMPALPMVGRSEHQNQTRPIIASFRGTNSHPVRQALHRIADGQKIVVELVDRPNHVGRIDVLAARADAEYESLLDRSVFAFVPRGDTLFSYRLLEVMSRGCIPVVLSDGWILPFDRLAKWETFSLRIPVDAIPEIPKLLGSIAPSEIAALRHAMHRYFATCFADLDIIVDSLLREVELIVETPGPEAVSRFP